MKHLITLLDTHESFRFEHDRRLGSQFPQFLYLDGPPELVGRGDLAYSTFWKHESYGTYSTAIGFPLTTPLCVSALYVPGTGEKSVDGGSHWFSRAVAGNLLLMSQSPFIPFTEQTFPLWPGSKHVPVTEPECHCESRALATIGHDGDCAYIKWKRSK